MGLPPKGEVVGGEPVARACGCVQEFQHHAGDKYRPQRLAKFQKTRCPACAAKLQAEQQAEQRRASVPRAEALRLLPPGARVSLMLGPDGVWAGTLTAGGVEVEFAGPTGAGPQAVVAALARLWLASRGQT
jgi:hypothetical protein